MTRLNRNLSMNLTRLNRLVPAAALLACVSAQAHVTLPAGGAAAGSTYTAAFRVGHVCKDAQSTTAVRVRLPAGFTLLEVPARPGWKVSQTATEVRWEAEKPEFALPRSERGTFVVQGRLTDKPGTLWFPVLQTCDKGQADWATIPAGEAEKPAFPAARLDVLPPGTAAVDVRDAWARTTVAGQAATGVFARIAAPSGARLVGGSSPVAGTVEIHEMKMDGNIMRMRQLEQGLELPRGEAVELRPGGYHIMLMGLKQPLAAGTQLPLVLRFVDAEGRAGTRELQVPVMTAPAGSAATGSGHEHHHHHHHHQQPKR